MDIKNRHERVFAIVSRIPRGRVATYGQIARMEGTHPRYVGYVLHQNKDPQNVPCHRVVNAKGNVAVGYAFGGKYAQQKKLEEEGIACVSGRVHLLKRYQWVP